MAQDNSKYTKPELRERIKDRIMESSKGGKPGQWSARRSQLLAQEYEKAGGGYKGGKLYGDAISSSVVRSLLISSGS